MHDELRVRMRDGIGDLKKEPEDRPHIEPRLADELVYATALDVLECEVGLSTVVSPAS
jgi:hypothetical protein